MIKTKFLLSNKSFRSSCLNSFTFSLNSHSLWVTLYIYICANLQKVFLFCFNPGVVSQPGTLSVLELGWILRDGQPFPVQDVDFQVYFYIVNCTGRRLSGILLHSKLQGVDFHLYFYIVNCTVVRLPGILLHSKLYSG